MGLRPCDSWNSAPNAVPLAVQPQTLTAPVCVTGCVCCAGAPDLAALAQSLREEQQLLAQQQQQERLLAQQQLDQRLAQQQREQQQREQQEQQQQQIASAAHVDSAARVANRTGSLTGGAEGELPSETSFQHLLQQEQWSNVQQQQPPPPQQQQHRDTQQQQQQQYETHKRQYHAGPPADAQRSSLLSEGAPAAVAARARPVRPVPAAAGMATAAPDPEPQPRQLPTMLLQQRTSAQPQLQQHPAGQMGMTYGAPPSQQIARGASHSQGGSSSVQDPPAAASLRSIRPAGATAGVALGVPQQAGAVQQAVADERVRRGGYPLHQQQQQQQQQSAPKQQDTQRLAPLSVKERLAARRQEALARQQQQRAAATAAAVIGAAAGSGIQRGLGVAGTLVPASDHPLAAAVQNSSRLLAAKIQVCVCGGGGGRVIFASGPSRSQQLLMGGISCARMRACG